MPHLRELFADDGSSFGRHLDEFDLLPDAEPESAASRLLDREKRGALGQAARQKDQPRLQIIREVGQANRRVEPELPVREVRAPALRVVAYELPEDRAGDALDKVVV